MCSIVSMWFILKSNLPRNFIEKSIYLLIFTLPIRFYQPNLITMSSIFSRHQVFQYNDHVIRAEKRSLFYTMEYSLIIDEVKQDQILGLYGILVLHGNIGEKDNRKPVKVIMKQRIFRTDFYCLIDGKMNKMTELKFDGL